MSDFFQTGGLTTLHRLGATDVRRIERELAAFSTAHPIALVLPCHARELGTPALRLLLRELREVGYLRQIIVGIDGANAAQWREAQRLFGALPQQPALLWNDGPRLVRLRERLGAADLAPGAPGKGRNIWTCFGYALACGEATVFAAHDCDILTYSRELLARLCYPVAHPHLGFDVCKGYSARYTTKLHGRVMRLMFTPLVRSLQSIIGAHPFLAYLDAFRYPLSGEICLQADLARRVRVPSDWGIEIGMLAEIFRNSAPRAICQAELAERYDHKHQELSARDPAKGLNRVAGDVAWTIFRVMAAEGIKLDAGLFDTLLSAFVRTAEDTLRQYNADAVINGLAYDRHEEEVAVATFARSIRTAARSFAANPLSTPLIPNWSRVQTVLPDFFDELREAVAADRGPQGTARPRPRSGRR